MTDEAGRKTLGIEWMIAHSRNAQDMSRESLSRHSRKRKCYKKAKRLVMFPSEEEQIRRRSEFPSSYRRPALNGKPSSIMPASRSSFTHTHTFINCRGNCKSAERRQPNSTIDQTSTWRQDLMEGRCSKQAAGPTPCELRCKNIDAFLHSPWRTS